MKNLVIGLGYVGLLAAGVGCATDALPEPEEGNAALGIEQFVVTETEALTTVIGLDANGEQVGHLDLVHGRFAPSRAFADDYAEGTTVVDGRKLEVEVVGHQLMWETAGYTPTLHMPAHDPSEWQLAAFLDDPHVQPILARWQIGFEPFQGGASEAENAYAVVNGNYSGWNLYSCTSSCGSIQGRNINRCNGGSGSAKRLTNMTSVMLPDLGWTDIEQYKIAQCCAPKAGIFDGNTPWFGIKTCPFQGNESECGTGNGACKGCPIYPVAAYSCSVWSYGGSKIYYSYDQTAPGMPAPE